MPGPSNYLNPAQTSLSHRNSFDEQYLQDQDDDGDDEELVKVDPNQAEEGVGEEGDADDQEPLYVNAKQYHRIVKRRAARARLEELNRLVRSRKVCTVRSTEFEADK
jgi:nuclear transcription factor Y alpha